MEINDASSLCCIDCGEEIDAVETVFVAAEWAEYHDDDGNIVGYRDGVEHCNYCPRCEARIFPKRWRNENNEKS